MFNNEYIRHFSEKSFDENIMSNISSKMKSIVFDSRRMNRYDEYNSYEYREEIFPFFLKLEFDKEKPSSIFKSLKDDEAIDYLISYMTTRENQQDLDSLSFTIKNDNNPLRKRNKKKIRRAIIISEIFIPEIPFFQTSINNSINSSVLSIFNLFYF